MHVRGSSLSQPRVVEILRPFLVSFWGQANDEPIPADLRPLYAASGRSHSNVRCFVLDAKGDLAHSFDGFPGPGSPFDYSPDQYAAYYTREIARAGLKSEVPPGEAPLRLPAVKSGVRLFVRLPGRGDSYGFPVVETVEDRGEWAALAHPKTDRQIEAQTLLRWLRLCYPPGVNEQLEPFRVARGKLTLKPAGRDQATLTGPVGLALSETGPSLFEGTFEAVLTYGPQVTLRGAVDGIYWRWDGRRNRWMDWKLTAAVESPDRNAGPGR